MADQFPPLSERITSQIEKAKLPLGGDSPFRPMLVKNRLGEDIIEKREIRYGPKRGKRGWVDEQNRIWIRDPAHADVPDHWDVQLDDGLTYVRVDFDGSVM